MQKKKRKRKRWAVGDGRIVFLLVATVLVLYMGRHIYMAYSGHIQTTAAVRVTANDSFTGTGWFFRNEVVVTAGAAGQIKHSVYSGERVQQDAALATIYATEDALSLSRQMDSVNRKITLYDAVMQTAGDGSDAAKLDQQITLGLQQMAEQIKSGSGSALGSSASSLRTLSLKRESGNLNPNELASERDALSMAQSELNSQLSGKATELTAPGSGYFSEVVDGYETILQPDLLDSITIAQFHELTEQQPVESNRQALGKIIQGFSWYLVVEAPEADALRLRKGDALRASFTQASLEAPVVVASVVRERGSETALVILEGNDFNSEMVSMRQQPVEVILGSYTGLRVPKEAVRVRTLTDSEGNTTEVTGVFILSGSVQKFKNITNRVLYEADNFYVVRQTIDSDALVVQDQIIINGKNLQNNMVVK